MSIDRLDDANIRLYQELASAKGSLDIYKIVGLNTDSIRKGKDFFGFVQMDCLSAVILKLCKIFEKSDRHRLCSIHGLSLIHI